jgi:hypothetical protein
MELGMVVQVFYPSIQESETGGSQVQGHPNLHNDIGRPCLKKKKEEKGEEKKKEEGKEKNEKKK